MALFHLSGSDCASRCLEGAFAPASAYIRYVVYLIALGLVITFCRVRSGDTDSDSASAPERSEICSVYVCIYTYCDWGKLGREKRRRKRYERYLRRKNTYVDAAGSREDTVYGR